jgi:putative ABC transport system permease protein
MSNVGENMRSALRALRENWLRSSLAMLGMIIGVGSVVLLVAIGQGVVVDITKQIEELGTNTVVVVPGKLDKNGQPNFMATLGISTLTDQDVATVSRVPGVTACVPVMFVDGTVEKNKKSYPATVIASKAGLFDVMPRRIEAGRVFGPGDENQPLCILAHEPKREVFGAGNAVGETITVRNKPFRVVGVLKAEEESLFGQFSFANMVYLPIDSARTTFKGGQINRMFLKLDFKRKPEPVLAAIKQTMMANHGGRDDFGVVTFKQIMGAIYKMFNIVQALLVGISAISLVVAGIGIMNIMLVTVTERTREIGIRKTVGARRQDIFLQFLIEAVVLATTGGIVGTLLAAGICQVVGAYSPLKPLITGSAILLAFGVCFLVGIVFGVAPAMRAARQDPIQALRWE